jgi:hypothetical protein
MAPPALVLAVLGVGLLQREGGGTGRGRLHVGVAIAIGLSGVVFVVGNDAIVMKIVIDGSIINHEVCRVRCGGVDEAGVPSSAPVQQGAGGVVARPDLAATAPQRWSVECGAV